jgi:hypothetical protein
MNYCLCVRFVPFSKICATACLFHFLTFVQIRIVALLGFVRNSIGANAYVSDEIITSHAGVRGILRILQSCFPCARLFGHLPETISALSCRLFTLPVNSTYRQYRRGGSHGARRLLVAPARDRGQGREPYHAHLCYTVCPSCLPVFIYGF